MFEAASECLQEAFQHKILRHICNTAGIERYPGAQFDMVRLGIGLYGIDPFTYQIINNVSTLKTTILQIHEFLRKKQWGIVVKDIWKGIPVLPLFLSAMPTD